MHCGGLRAPSRAGCTHRQLHRQPAAVRPAARVAAPRASSSTTTAAVDKQQPDWNGEPGSGPPIAPPAARGGARRARCDAAGPPKDLPGPPRPRPPGDKLLSQLVNFLINTPPIWAVMKYFAKNAMKSTATKKGVDWDAYARGVLAAEPEVRGY